MSAILYKINHKFKVKIYIFTAFQNQKKHKHDDVEKNLCHSDLFLLPSSTESFGLAALEAMASKVPVISSNAGGLPAINIHGETGYLTDFNDIDSMSNYSISILKDKSTLEKFKNKAFENALNYDINIVVPMYEEIYEKALKNL